MHTMLSCAFSFSSFIHFGTFSYVPRRVRSNTINAPDAPL